MPIHEVITEHLFDNRCEVIRKVRDHGIIGFDVGELSSLDGLLPDGEHGNGGVRCESHPLDGEITPGFTDVRLMPSGTLFLCKQILCRRSSIARAGLLGQCFDFI